jgi:hypothetical protein
VLTAVAVLLLAVGTGRARGDSLRLNPGDATAYLEAPSGRDGRALDQPTPAPSQLGRLGTLLRLSAGGASAFALHESSHLLADTAFDAGVRLRRVKLGPIPFFAIIHPKKISMRQEFVVSSAGFWSQHVTSEIILTAHPDVRSDHAPFEKGVLAFNILTSAGYAVTAFARAGPPERDPRSMAISANIPEPWIGALILAPAALDTYRYYRPHSPTARWASRAIKVGAVLLIFAAH